MGGAHWLLLIPYYFFAALCCLLLFILVSRLVRARVPISALVLTAIAVSLGAILMPLATGWASLGDYTVSRMLLLGAASLLLAGVDALIDPWLPLPLDRELHEL